MSNARHIKGPPMGLDPGTAPDRMSDFPRGGKRTNHEAKDCRGTASPRGKITNLENPTWQSHEEKVYVPPRDHGVDANAMASLPDLMSRNMAGHEEKPRGKMIANLPHPESRGAEVVYRGKQYPPKVPVIQVVEAEKITPHKTEVRHLVPAPPPREIENGNVFVVVQAPPTVTTSDFPQGGKRTNHEAKDCRGTASPRGKITNLENPTWQSQDPENVYHSPRQHTVEQNAMASRPDIMMRNMDGHEEKLRGKIANMPHPETKSFVYRGKQIGAVDVDVDKVFHQTHEVHRCAEAEKISHETNSLMKMIEGHEGRHRGRCVNFPAPPPREQFQHHPVAPFAQSSVFESSNVKGFKGLTKAPEVMPAGRARGANSDKKPNVAPYLAGMPDAQYQGYHIFGRGCK